MRTKTCNKIQTLPYRIQKLLRTLSLSNSDLKDFSVTRERLCQFLWCKYSSESLKKILKNLEMTQNLKVGYGRITNLIVNWTAKAI